MRRRRGRPVTSRAIILDRIFPRNCGQRCQTLPCGPVPHSTIFISTSIVHCQAVGCRLHCRLDVAVYSSATLLSQLNMEDQLLCALEATLSADNAQRQAAEASLEQLTRHGGKLLTICARISFAGVNSDVDWQMLTLTWHESAQMLDLLSLPLLSM